MVFLCTVSSPLGGITLSSDGEALTGLWFDGQRHFAEHLPPEREVRQLAVFEQAARWLDLYFAGVIPDLTPPVRLSGTPFQTAVWELLKTIPYGQTVTYGELARLLEASRGGKPTSARAVGQAVGRNPVSLIVPCHRVLGGGGAVTGYAGGVRRKLALLELEKKALSAAEKCGILSKDN